MWEDLWKELDKLILKREEVIAEYEAIKAVNDSNKSDNTVNKEG